LIWAVASPDRLSGRARKALNAGPLVLSVVSYWEIVIKAHKGMLKVADPVNWWSRATALLAQSAAEGLALVTGDDQMRQYSVKIVW
jgi:PIN domain nuclease of toxin-antitoxin system